MLVIFFSSLLVLYFTNSTMASSRLKVNCNLEGAEVFLDGKFKGECPVEFEVSVGKHTVVLRKDIEDGSYYYYERETRVGEDVVQEINATLERIYTEQYYWDRAEKHKKIEYYKEYLMKYPNGTFVEDAKMKIESVKGELINQPDGVYLLTSDEKLIQLENKICQSACAFQAPNGYQFAPVRPTGEDECLFFPTIKFCSLSELENIPVVEEGMIKGVYIKSPRERITRLNQLALMRDYFENAGIGEANSVHHVVQSGWGLSAHSLTFKTIDESTLFVTITGLDAIKTGSVSSRKKANISSLGLYIQTKAHRIHMYPFFTTAALNAFLWNMHETQHYIESYNFFLERLENNTSNPSCLDTVAWVYKDHGDQEQAIQIYTTRILPTIQKTGDSEKIDQFNTFFEEIRNKKIGDENIQKPEEIGDEGIQKREETIARMKALGTALWSYKIDYNMFPIAEQSTISNITFKTSPKDGLPANYYEGPVKDGWGTDFYYNSVDGQNFTLKSWGKDKVEGSGGDEFDSDIVYINGKFVAPKAILGP